MKTTTQNETVNYFKQVINVLIIVFLAFNCVSASAQQAKKMKDPFAGDSWHAISPSWPGTFKFDAKTGKALLEPMGATPIEVTYSYTLNPQSVAPKAKMLEGKLRMVNAAGQVSESSFTMVNQKDLTLTFANGQRSEKYQRYTPKEEKLERERLEKLFKKTGTLKPIQ